MTVHGVSHQMLWLLPTVGHLILRNISTFQHCVPDNYCVISEKPLGGTILMKAIAKCK